jgi:hypothetical protein
MGSVRLINHLMNIAFEDFHDGDEVDIIDLSNKLYKRTGKVRWSSNEIAGAMPKVRDIYVPTGCKNKHDLNTYIVSIK